MHLLFFVFRLANYFFRKFGIWLILVGEISENLHARRWCYFALLGQTVFLNLVDVFAVDDVDVHVADVVAAGEFAGFIFVLIYGTWTPAINIFYQPFLLLAYIMWFPIQRNLYLILKRFELIYIHIKHVVFLKIFSNLGFLL